MKLKIIKASNINKILKATAHKSGKLGFTKDGAEFLGLDVGKSAIILMDEENVNDKNLYVKIYRNHDNKDAFKIGKAGEYYYINLKAFFDHQDEDYENGDIVYSLSKTKIEGEDLFVFKRKLKEEATEIDEE